MKGWPAADDAHAQIAALERRRQQALIAVDLDALGVLMAEDLIHVHSSGLVHDKAGLLRHVAVRGGFAAIERGPLSMRVEGDMAVMGGAVRNVGRAPDPQGVLVLQGYVTQVLRRTAGGWQFIHFQFTRDLPACSDFTR